jgi:V/A-type H+-transporting ATPase subunit D
MRINVNPNRMELLRLRKRLLLAERGHKLLKDKLEEIMRRFLELTKRLNEIQQDIGPKLDRIMLSFAVTQSAQSVEALKMSVPEGVLDLEIKEEKVFNLTIPKFSIKELKIADYDLFLTEGELDVGIKAANEILQDMMEMARLWKAVEFLSEEIEVTRRRVNALEHILIPNIKETIRYISSRLEEMERSYQVQLMRVKEIVREH